MHDGATADDAAPGRPPARAARRASVRARVSRGTIRRVVSGAKPIRAKNRCRSASCPPTAPTTCAAPTEDAYATAAASSAAPAVVAVDDEVVDGHLRHTEDHRQRVDAEDGQADDQLAAARPAVRGVRPGQDGEHDPVRRVGEQPAEAGGRRGPGGLPGQHPLGVGLGAVLAHQGEHGGQVGGTRGARRDAGPGTGN